MFVNQRRKDKVTSVLYQFRPGHGYAETTQPYLDVRPGWAKTTGGPSHVCEQRLTIRIRAVSRQFPA